MEATSIPGRLRELRKGRSQAEVAYESGMSQSIISALELGSRSLTPETAQKLAPVLGSEVLQIVENEYEGLEDYLSLEEAGQVMNPPKNSSQMKRLCEMDRITPSPIKKEIRGIARWFIPKGFRVSYPANWGVLDERRKNNIARRYITRSATGKELAEEYGIDPSYPSQLVKRGYPKF